MSELYLRSPGGGGEDVRMKIAMTENSRHQTVQEVASSAHDQLEGAPSPPSLFSVLKPGCDVPVSPSSLLSLSSSIQFPVDFKRWEVEMRLIPVRVICPKMIILCWLERVFFLASLEDLTLALGFY